MAHLISDQNQNRLINAVVSELNLVNYEIVQEEGSKKGDNYVGILKKLGVKGTKENGNEFSLNLIFKQAPSNERRRKVFSCEECFRREIFMYETVLPIFSKMEQDNSIKQKLRYADLYATSKLPYSESLILEDLTVEGYEIKNRKQIFDYQHCISVMKFFGRLHSFSFILKNRNPELYQHISDLPETFLNQEFLEYYQNLRMDHTIQRIVACLDPEKENHLIDKVREFAGNFTHNCMDCFSGDTAEGFTVINHGDSWINNIFFSYEDNSKKVPTSVCFVDWQLSRCASPLIDVIYFIYSSTDKQFRKEHLKTVYEEYYTSLSKSIEEFGDKIEDHFPYAVFQKHIQLFSKFGLVVTMIFLQVFLSNEEEVFDSEEIVSNRETYEEAMMKKALNDEVFRTRVHDIVEDLHEAQYI